MEDKAFLGCGLIVAIVLFIFIVSCNASMCQGKGGHLTISLLNSAGYACVDESDRVIPLP